MGPVAAPARRPWWVVPAAVAALAAVPAAYLLLRPEQRAGPAASRGPYLVSPPGAGWQGSVFGDGEYGFVTSLDVLVPGVSVVSVTPLDGTGGEVPHTVAAIEDDLAAAQQVLYGMAAPRASPLPVAPGDELHLLLRLRPDCADAVPVTAVRVVLTVRGQPAEQVLGLAPEHLEMHAERTRGICAPR